jgi:hypothetical protein
MTVSVLLSNLSPCWRRWSSIVAALSSVASMRCLVLAQLLLCSAVLIILVLSELVLTWSAIGRLPMLRSTMRCSSLWWSTICRLTARLLSVTASLTRLVSGILRVLLRLAVVWCTAVLVVLMLAVLIVLVT